MKLADLPEKLRNRQLLLLLELLHGTVNRFPNAAEHVRDGRLGSCAKSRMVFRAGPKRFVVERGHVASVRCRDFLLKFNGVVSEISYCGSLLYPTSDGSQ
jgi:hypothetical protein